MDMEYAVVLANTPDLETAEKIANGLVEGKLAACVSIVAGVSSVYRWEDKVEKSEEFQLIIKTRSGLLPEVSEFVRSNHPDKIPETICLPIINGNPAYLDWLGANTIIAKDVPKWSPGDVI